MTNSASDTAVSPRTRMQGPLVGIKVLDLGNLFAGPLVGTLLADMGADVIKVERPGTGDSLRNLGWRHEKSSDSLWWKVTGRNKQSLTADLHFEEDQQTIRSLAQFADVLIDGFRPGVLETWNLGWESLHSLNPSLIMCRISGFGQDGPYRNRPGFGTLAEAMSGFANINGWPDRPPSLPPFGLADGIAAITGAFATAAALVERDRGSGEGQMIDISLVEPLLSILGPQLAVYEMLGIEQGRSGNRTPFSAPRGAYQCSDGRWVALSGSTQEVAQRVFVAIGHPEMNTDPRFSKNDARVANADAVDAVISGWASTRTSDEALRILEAHDVAAAPVLGASQILDNEHFQERQSFIRVTDDELGEVPLPNVIARFSRTPGAIVHTGARLDSIGDEIDLIRDEWRQSGR